jgi:hypothetical protein
MLGTFPLITQWANTNDQKQKRPSNYTAMLTDDERAVLRQALYADHELVRLARVLVRRQRRCLAAARPAGSRLGLH